MENYLEAVQGLDLEKSVHLEADVDEAFMLDETRHILALAEQNNPLEGVVACGRPENTAVQDNGYSIVRVLQRKALGQGGSVNEEEVSISTVGCLSKSCQ